MAGKDVPTKFARPSRMQPLPIPVAPPPSAPDPLRPFTEGIDDKNYPLLVSWLTAALCGLVPYPIAYLSGPQGSGKSLRARLLRALIDPSAVPLWNFPTNERDLAALARNDHLLVFDIHQTYLSSVENGVRNPTIMVLKNLADALGMALSH